MPEPRNRASMTDVATRAGVSGQTVSRVVNGLPNVGEATRQRVEAAMAELNYRPHRAARVLRTGRSQAIGVVVTTLESVGNSLMLQAITDAAAERGHSIALTIVTEPTPAAFASVIDQLAEADVDGAIVVNEAAMFVSAMTPVDGLRLVLIDAGDDAAYPTVRSDHEDAAASITAHIFDATALTVHHVAGPVGSVAAVQREAGWRRAVEAIASNRVGALPLPSVIRGDWTAASGYLAGKTLAADPGVHAVFCANDQMALGVMRAMHEAGRSIPSDVAIAGFDGIADAADFWPPLTTMEQDFPGLARTAVHTLIDGGTDHAVRPARIRYRESSRY